MTEDLAYFELLKKKIAITFRETYPESSPNMEDWKGQEITNFQEELIAKANGRISEKWFYTHIKTKSEKLPRIDILNLLSVYVDYKNWNEFKRLCWQEIQPLIDKDNPPGDVEKGNDKKPEVEHSLLFNSKRFQRKWLWESLAMVVVFVIVGFFYNDNEKSEKQTATVPIHQFCFVDADTKAPITGQPVELVIIKENESPVTKKCDKNGCFEFKAKDGMVKFVVKAPYYRTDTITRNLKAEQQETIPLKTDDYALMIRIFSQSAIKDWKKRREQLNEMIHDEARILQVKNQANGMEMYNKQEFINKMTMPLESLKNIEIIETHYTRGGKIISIRFSQMEKQ